MESQALWYKLGFWLFSQPSDIVKNGFDSLTIERLKVHDKDKNGKLELEEFKAIMKDAFPNNPLSKVPVCEIDQETRDFFAMRHGISKEHLQRDIAHDAALNIPEKQKITELAMSKYLLRFKNAFPKGFDSSTPECELISQNFIGQDTTQYATATGSSERQRYHVATER